MKILLVRPRPPKETIGLQSVMICEPLELEYLVANIKPLGHEIEILDMILERNSLEYYIKKYNPEVVGITGYISHVNVIKNYAKEIKGVSRAIKVVVGGVHAEVVPEDFLSEHIDYIIRANGIQTFTNIINSLETHECSKVPGTYGGEIIEKAMEFTWKHPDRKSVSRYRNRYYYMFHNPCALIKTSYGCPYKCSFCFCRNITDGKYFARDLEDIVCELKDIEEEEVYIVDDDFLFNKERLLKFAEILKAHGIKKKFLVYGRSDFIAENQQVIEKLSEVGLRACIVGLESSSEEELIKYNKKSEVKLNERAVEVLQKYDIECYATLILGIDWGKEDFDRLYQWVKKLNIRFVNLQPFTPLPGTDLFQQYKNQLIVKREEYEKWDLAHLTVTPSKLSIRNYYFNIIKLYYKIIMRPSNVLYIIKKYGFLETLKLSIGSSNISMQYILKAIRGK
ncbi:B12-binding domain-containing radical SAM protein [Clostridium tunisiense]|uniref:B12-binding domain-containing radical SAM protein n=1 Tax=Clostridium tunisiense TaxID=219748 RepID=UPI000313D68D|nr:B12-binding domain-containing radical SAM protein [Clostridium tunisiense]